MTFRKKWVLSIVVLLYCAVLIWIGKPIDKETAGVIKFVLGCILGGKLVSTIGGDRVKKVVDKIKRVVKK